MCNTVILSCALLMGDQCVTVILWGTSVTQSSFPEHDQCVTQSSFPEHDMGDQSVTQSSFPEHDSWVTQSSFPDQSVTQSSFAEIDSLTHGGPVCNTVILS